MVTAELKDGLKVGVRLSCESDESFVLSTWKESLAESSMYKLCRRRKLMAMLSERCDSLYKDSRVTVACDPENEDVIIGWACISPETNVAHYVYIRPDFRRHGVASLLLGGLKEPIVCSHWTSAAEMIQPIGRLIYCASSAQWSSDDAGPRTERSTNPT